MGRNHSPGRTKYKCPPPPAGATADTIDPRGVVARGGRRRGGVDFEYVVWHDPPCLITITEGRVAGVEEFPDGPAAFAAFTSLTEETGP